MDRSRRTTHRRRHLGASASPTSVSEASFDFNQSTSPVVAHTNTTPQSAGARRSSKPLQHAFTFSPPGNNRGQNPRKRSTTMDNYPVPDEGGHGPKKGGHSLRKRARVDYTFEHIDDDVLVPNSTSSARGRKRRSEINYDVDDFYSTDSKRRGASMGADTPSNRRRNPSRKSSELKAYHEAALEDDDNEVQDTIEVGAYYSDAGESEFREPSGSNHSSPKSNKLSPTNKPAAPQTGDCQHAIPSTENTPGEDIKPVPQVEQNASEPPPVVKPIEKPVSVQPAEPQTEQLPKVEPGAEALYVPQTPTANPIDAAVRESDPEPVREPVRELESEPVPVSVPETKQEPKPEESVPAPAVITATAGDGRQTEEIHSSPDRRVNGALELPAVEAQTIAAPAIEAPAIEAVPQEISTSINNIKEETSHHATIEEAPESPAQSPNQYSEDEMDIDTFEQPAEDIDMAEAASPPVEEPTPAASPAPGEESPDNTNTSTNNDNENMDPAPMQVNGITIGNEQDDEPLDLAATANEVQISDSPQIPVNEDEPVAVSSPAETKAPTPPPPTDTVETPASSAPSETKSSPQKPTAPRPIMASKSQPTPDGRWAHLTPYVDGEYISYPEKKGRSEDDAAADDATPEGKDADREGIDMEPMMDDNDDNADAAVPEAPTPALNTPTRGSPVPDSTDPTAFNSPAPGGDDPDDVDVSESQEPPERRRYFKYRKLRDPEEYISAIENHEDMSTEDLYEILEAINVSMVQWQQEWTGLGKIVDDYENSLRRRAADSKYEARTRNLHQHGVNYEEPDFAVKGYKGREKEGMSETRYLQSQDRIMAANYGFEYDPHPSKIGKQNPETQQVGIMTRGRSLRNQPRQTAKATETDEVVGKRQRKPVQLFDPATQDVSRSSTPVPTTRGRRRKNANADDDAQTNLSVSFNNDVASEGEATAPKTRRKRGPRPKTSVPNIVEDILPTPDAEDSTAQEESAKPSRRGRGRPAVKYEEADPNEFVEEEPQEEKPHVRRHILTLKIPKSKFFSAPASAISDNGESRPSTATSEESSHTVESSYSFRPKRQKRFRDDPDEAEESAEAPPKKKGKRASGIAGPNDVPSRTTSPVPSAEPTPAPNNRKVQKIKVVRSGADSKNVAPVAAAPTDDGDDTPKDYKSMTKSEKMSASMKNRWANGNMAGAVEKRKATLAAKKAAQAAAEQRLGVVAPKPKGKAAAKREAAVKMQIEQQQMQEQEQHQQMEQQHIEQQQMEQQQMEQQHIEQQHIEQQQMEQQQMHQRQQMMQQHQQQQQQQQMHQHQHQHQHQHHHAHPQHPLHLQQQQPLHQPHPQHPPPPPHPHQGGAAPFIHGHSHSHSHGHGMPGMGYPYQ
ncbi:hypothetical protein FZEAL_7052 [Fusarium zealandicum]|uniref:Uncharacterized protein n=1 Tax=Fusarium zealandicum TaxID=1053134 RepID=A0A8H4XIV4_9HYPO|nr:hypothetical protein FZEAL_7052 [Fusarium zealandicum]